MNSVFIPLGRMQQGSTQKYLLGGLGSSANWSRSELLTKNLSFLFKMTRLAMHKTENVFHVALKTGFGGSPVTILKGRDAITRLLVGI